MEQINIGSELQRPEKKFRHKKLILFAAISLLIAVLALVAWGLVPSTVYLAFCHEMKPELVTWQASSHSQISCGECHRANYTSMLYKHVARQYLLPIEQSGSTPDQVCEKCHDMTKRLVTPSGDIKISHLQHLAQSITCVQCHSGVVHGNIARRQQTIDGEFGNWTVKTGKVQLSPHFTLMEMKECIECHRSKNAALSCETCHKKIVPPADHKTPAWIDGEHGREARKNIEACDRCHSATKENLTISGVDTVTGYARTNSFCYECHSKAPPSHDDAWQASHGPKADVKQDCLVCHNSNRPKGIDKAAKTFCQKCHVSKHAAFDKSNHPVPIPPGPKLAASCTRCHSASNCAACHLISGS